MTLGQKIKEARVTAGMTQEQLSVHLSVSRQAITKWESDKGMPDIKNLKLLSKALGVSVDYLLDDGTALDMNVIREPVDFTGYLPDATKKPSYIEKGQIKDIIIKEKYPHAEIYSLQQTQKLTKSEKIVDKILGWCTDASFGIPQIINAAKNVNIVSYLVNDDKKQWLVTITDEFMESRQLAQKIETKKFTIGQFEYRALRKIQEGEV